MQWSENSICMVDLTAERVKLERVMDQKCHKMGLNKTKYIRVLVNHYKLKSIVEENIDDYKNISYHYLSRSVSKILIYQQRYYERSC